MSKKKAKDTEKVALSLRLPVALHSKLQTLAKEERRSINQQAQMILEKEFQF
jgi:hypothetical protein